MAPTCKCKLRRVKVNFMNILIVNGNNDICVIGQIILPCCIVGDTVPVDDKL